MFYVTFPTPDHTEATAHGARWERHRFDITTSGTAMATGYWYSPAPAASTPQEEREAALQVTIARARAALVRKMRSGVCNLRLHDAKLTSSPQFGFHLKPEP